MQEEKRTKHEALQPWANVLKRLREISPEYVQGKEICGLPKLINKKQKNAKCGIIAIEHFIKKLLLELKLEDLETKPCETVLNLLKTKIDNNVFGSQIQHTIKLFPRLPIHQDILVCFTKHQLNDQLMEQIQKIIGDDEKINEQMFIASFNALRRKNKYDEQTLLGDIKQHHAMQYCVIGDNILQLRIAMLMVCGNKFTKEQLYKDAQTFLVIKQNARNLCQLLELPSQSHATSAYIKLWEIFGMSLDQAVMQLQTNQIIDGFNTVKRYKNESKIMIIHIATTHNKIELLNVLGDIKIEKKKLNQAQKFAQMSIWHELIVKDLLQLETKNTNSGYPKKHVRMIMARFGGFSLFLDAQARKINGDNSNALPKFLKTANVENITKVVEDFLRKQKVWNDRVKSQVHLHHAGKPASFCLRFLKGVFKKHIGCFPDVKKLTMNDLISNIPNLRVPADGSKRRTFTDQEIESMFNVASNPVETLILTLFREVALRNAAMAHIQYQMLLDENHNPRHECAVKEKFNKTRRFICSPNLKQKIKAASDFLRKSFTDDIFQRECYLLNWKNPSQPLGAHALGLFLKNIALNAGISDVHVHPHGFRHTLVTKLCLLNPMDIVSKFIGHDDIRTTSYFYFKPTAEEIDRTLKNPFSENYVEEIVTQNTTDVLLDAANQKILATRKILDMFLMHADDNLKSKLSDIIPNYQEILGAIDTVTCITDSNDDKNLEDANETNMDDFE